MASLEAEKHTCFSLYLQQEKPTGKGQTVYDWKQDVEDCEDVLDRDEYDEIAYYLVEQHPDEEDFINLFRISIYSALYELLEQWYEEQGKNLEDEVRGYFEYGDYVYFVTGSGYSIYSADLLGGSANGRAENEFDEFVDNHF